MRATAGLAVAMALLAASCQAPDSFDAENRVCIGDADCLDDYRCAPRRDGVEVCLGECDQHRDCASGACDLANQTCLAEADVRYVDEAGSGSCQTSAVPCCTRAEPCGSVQAAATAAPLEGQAIVVAPGTHAGTLLLGPTDQLTIIGAGATPEDTILTSGAVTIQQSQGQLSLEHLTVTTSSGEFASSIIHCESSLAAPATLRLHQVRVDSVDQLYFAVYAYACRVEISRSLVRDARVGLHLEASVVDVTNNVILDSRHAVSLYDLNPNALGTGPRSRVAFNTFFDSSPVANQVSIFDCGGSLDFAFSSIISWATAPDAVDGIDCGATQSIIAVAGTDDPGLLAGDFHLPAGSPALGLADPGLAATDGWPPVDIDFDGDPRPQGNGPDSGADERNE